MTSGAVRGKRWVIAGQGALLIAVAFVPAAAWSLLEHTRTVP
jgi:hypothetical protein